MKTRKEIVELLKNKNLRIFPWESLTCTAVVFEERGKFKIGLIRNDWYSHRYGIDVFVTIKPGSSFPWFKSKYVRESFEDSKVLRDSLLSIITEGRNYISTLPVFDPETIPDIAW